MAGGHVLIVDDSPSIRFLLVRTFEVSGFRVTAAETAVDADAALASDPPDIVILDQVLPDLQGTELVKAWRRRGLSVPVVIVSCVTADEIRAEATRLGVTYVPKPFSPLRLVERVQTMLEPSALSA